MRLATTHHLPALRDAFERRELTYPEVGASLDGLPAGYHHLRRTTDLGAGEEVFDVAARALLTWKAQQGAGLRVVADGAPTPGQTVVMGLGLGVRLVVPCRVVAVVDQPDRKGFAYGTLPGHPESGEELFVVSRLHGRVVLEITAFSRPASVLSKLAGPIARAAQLLTTRRYEQALLAAVRHVR